MFLGKVDYQLNEKHLATIRYNYTWSEQVNGTFDVDSWGTSANAIEQDYSHAVTGSLISSLSGSLLNEFRFQWAKEWRPRPYNGPDIIGQSRPLPDTAFDFGSAYRFGMPFFIPVDYFDQRFQFNDNLSVIKGRHAMKFGVEFNRVNSNQTFRGFQNGRYIFGSTDGFLNYAQNPRYVECSDGIHSQNGSCPAGASITGPLLLFLQQFGVNGLSAEEAGTQDIPQTELAIFAQDKWQPSPSLTVQYGLRWEMQKQADVITPASEVFFAPLIGQTVTNAFGTFRFPSNGEIISDYKMFQPRVGISWDPDGGRQDGGAPERRSLLRPHPGPVPRHARARPTAAGPRTPSGQASSTASASRHRRTPTCFRRRPEKAPPITPACSSSTRTSRTPARGRARSAPSARWRRTWPSSSSTTTRRASTSRASSRATTLAFGCPWSTGIGPDGQNGIRAAPAAPPASRWSSPRPRASTTASPSA